MRQTFSIRFYARQSKVNKDGLAPIECSIIVNGERTIFNLSRKESPRIFNSKRRPQELTEFLELTREGVYKAQNYLLSKGMPVTPENLRKVMRGEIREEKNTVGNLCAKWLKVMVARIGNEITQEVYGKYQRTATLISDYFGKDTLLETLKPGDIQMLVLGIKTRYKISTAAGILNRVKAYLRYGQREGNIMTDLWGDIKIQKGKPEIIFLTDEEMDRIKNHTWTCERLQKVADLSIFQANSGLSYIDLANLKPEDMQQTAGYHYIQKSRCKTGRTFTSVILPDGMEIWNKYAGHLPVLSNQRYNAYLDEIQDLCGIKKNLHTHIFRKTYACRLLRNQVPIEVVSRSLGHSSSRITEMAYADILATDICQIIGSKIG